MSRISRILIANRGEIACRVMRTARQMGIKTVAVYSDADADALHVREADEAVHIGPSPALQSYLVIEKIIEAAKATGADAIHPGYGFLSENADFAEACGKAGVMFIGPPVQAIDVMGDKAKAKRAMIAAGVPCVPGYQGEDQSDETLLAEAEAIGFPIMVKAAAGGGGRGMRLVEAAKDLPGALELARSEAERSFGSGTLILEKAIQKPRHIEIQIMADGHGNVLHLGERDCSVQRRHQKVIEEAPSPAMTSALREEMGAAAVAAARAVDYCGAGTVEFLLAGDGAFYFLEMNTRLQVEHPVTEEITGLDLVRLQIAVAQGEELGIAQEDVQLSGHAIEVRLYAEDPAKGFLPSTGPLHLWVPPTGPGVRVDDGLVTGGKISAFYDAMVAKIIGYGRTREEARARLVAALERTALFGVKTNRDFLVDALSRPAFVAGAATTAFIEEEYGAKGYQPAPAALVDLAPAIALDLALQGEKARAHAICVSEELLGWSSTRDLRHASLYALGKETHEVTLTRDGEAYAITSGDETARVLIHDMQLPHVRLSVEGEVGAYLFCRSETQDIYLAGQQRTLILKDLSQALKGAGEGVAGGRVTAPMHGKLLEITVKTGDKVRKGDTLAVLEAMKMQHEVLATIDGKVGEIAAKPGAQIAGDALILDITPAKGSKT